MSAPEFVSVDGLPLDADAGPAATAGGGASVSASVAVALTTDREGVDLDWFNWRGCGFRRGARADVALSPTDEIGADVGGVCDAEGGVGGM